jgi:hypothetical protein
METEIIEFDDVNTKFDFGALFVYLTSDLTIERKWQSKQSIPKKYAPKAVVSTNYTIKGIGDGFERRKHEVEISSYFTPDYQPFDEYGKRFFEQWDTIEWNKFDSMMIDILQDFLKTGLIQHAHKNLEIRRLSDMTSMEFVEFIEDYLHDEIIERLKLIKHAEHVNNDAKFDVKNLFYIYQNEYDQDISTQKQFVRWLAIFANIFGYKRHKGHSMNTKYVWFTKKERRNEHE